MSKDNVLEIYDENYAQEYNQRFLLNEASKKNADFEEETISKLLDEIGERATWLDVACGTGYFLSRFSRVKRAGLDISPAMLEVAQQANPNALLVQGDYRDKRPQWENKWDLVSCMWWAYCYVESISELETVIANFADWASNQGICFFPVCDPEEMVTGGSKLSPIRNVPGYGGEIQVSGIFWNWIDEESDKQHKHLLAPQVEAVVEIFKRHFDQVEIIEYSVSEGWIRKAIVARSKKQKIPETKAKIEIPTPSGFLSSFSKAIRSQDWWLYKIPPLLAIAYAEILLLNLPVLQSLLTVSALLFSSVCVAAYGYIINDSFDIEVDRQVGKNNSMAQFSPWQRALFCLVLAGLGFILPIVMNFGFWSIVLLGINYLLPTLYSAPPFRLKEKGILGIISDAAGAHAIPTLFIATTFSHWVAASPQAIGFTIVATAWSFFAGVRGILLHQLWDRDDDLRSDVKTLVTESEVEKVRAWMSRIVFPIELLLFGLLILTISPSAPLVLVFTIFYFLFKLTLSKSDPTASFDPAPVQKSYVVPHDFYEVGLPIVLATVLSLQNEWFSILLLLQVLLFYTGIERRVNNLVQSLRGKPQNLQPLQSQLNASQAEVAQLKTHLQQSQNHLEQVQAQLQHLQTDSQNHHSEMQTALSIAQADSQQLDEQSKQMQALRQQVTQALTQFDSERQTLQAEVTRLKAYLHAQGTESMMNYYRNAIATNPDDLQLYYQALEIQFDAEISLQLARALARQEQMTEAIARYQTALQSHPDHFELHFELAKALKKNQQWDEAIVAYRQAIELNPNHALAHQQLGDVLAKCGQLHEASLSYRRSLQASDRS